ncbi:MAG: efflux transporter outer membrane subunit [Pseudomonadota bacterium]|nr:efflux transporter outer membrane subunit [Pseudomonadota bacterium]
MRPLRCTPALLCIALAGCAVAPAPVAPAAPVLPAQWRSGAGAGMAVAHADIAWWERFDDAALTSLIRRAAAANLDVALASARVRETRGRAGIASAALRPGVRARAAATRERDSEHAPAPVLFGADGNPERPGARADNLFQAGFDASWELDVFGAGRQAALAAQADVDAVEFDLGAVRVTLFAEVARNYVVLRGQQQHIAAARADLADQSSAAGLVRARHAGGLASELDVVRSDAQVKLLAAQIAPLETGRRLTLHRLAVLLGQAPGALDAELAAARPIPLARPGLPTGLPSDLLRQRPDIRRAERQLAASAARMGVAAADLYPSFSLGGSAGLASVSAGDFFSVASLLWKVGPTINWPILRRGQVVASIAVHDARQQQALIAYRIVILNALEEVENAIAFYQDAQARQAALAAALQGQALALSLSRSRYLGGLADLRDVLDAQHRQAVLGSDVIQGEVDVATAAVALHKALGGGWCALPGGGATDVAAEAPCSTLP